MNPPPPAGRPDNRPTLAQPGKDGQPRHVYAPGAVIPGTSYMVRKKLGEGGMGVVYEVEDTSIGKVYVVKTVHFHHAGKATYATLTRNEARILAKLRHRNIVQVITAGTTDDENELAYFVMEKLEGCTVGSLRGVALPLTYVWQIGSELLDALQYVHHPRDDRPVIVHRDIKPDNIFLARIEEDEGGDSVIRHRVKLLDFGIGAVVGDRPAGFWGTARYASPEQLNLEPVTPKTDLYAAGVVLFELLTGRHPFEGAKSAQEFMDAHRVQVPPRLSEFIHVPKAVDDCIDAALSKLPAQRPRDAHKMMSALSELRHGVRTISVPAHANTTIEDLNTVIERQTESGYEAYATSSADTIDGMSRPPVEGRPVLENAYAFGLSPIAVAATERAEGLLDAGVVAAVAAAGKGNTVPMAPTFREAPTRSLLDAPPARRGKATDTAEIDTDQLLEGLTPRTRESMSAGRRQSSGGHSASQARGSAPQLPQQPGAQAHGQPAGAAGAARHTLRQSAPPQAQRPSAAPPHELNHAYGPPPQAQRASAAPPHELNHAYGPPPQAQQRPSAAPPHELNKTPRDSAAAYGDASHGQTAAAASQRPPPANVTKPSRATPGPGRLGDAAHKLNAKDASHKRHKSHKSHKRGEGRFPTYVLVLWAVSGFVVVAAAIFFVWLYRMPDDEFARFSGDAPPIAAPPASAAPAPSAAFSGTPTLDPRAAGVDPGPRGAGSAANPANEGVTSVAGNDARPAPAGGSASAAPPVAPVAQPVAQPTRRPAPKPIVAGPTPRPVASGPASPKSGASASTHPAPDFARTF